MDSKIKIGILLICDNCLKELIIPNEEFFPWNPTSYEETKGWEIAELIMETVKGKRETPTSNVICLCEGCAQKFS